MSAAVETSMSAGILAPVSTMVSTGNSRDSETASTTTPNASSTISWDRRSRSARYSCGNATGKSSQGPTSSAGWTCTMVSGTCRSAASRAAQSTAASEDGDPSTATTMP